MRWHSVNIALNMENVRILVLLSERRRAGTIYVALHSHVISCWNCVYVPHANGYSASDLLAAHVPPFYNSDGYYEYVAHTQTNEQTHSNARAHDIRCSSASAALPPQTGWPKTRTPQVLRTQRRHGVRVGVRISAATTDAKCAMWLFIGMNMIVWMTTVVDYSVVMHSGKKQHHFTQIWNSCPDDAS